MKRGIQGDYKTISTVGEKAQAFVPFPLPPKPSVVWSGQLQTQFAAAHAALGRLDGISSVLPERSVFLYSYVRKEAVLSSQIEGTQSSLSDLLLFENDQAPGVPLNNVQEVSNCVAALELHRLFQSHPICSVREAHKTLPFSIPTLHAASKHLIRLGILRELPAQGKTHLFAYTRYLEILNSDAGD